MESITDFLGNVSVLSSTGLFGAIFGLLKVGGDWADNVANLIGLLG
ncbi:PorA family porin [Corynebacterium gallinarum]|uniref:PorA family porin n=1 Tax=Corynebacterium gallinarum TaxID=2762214 RepID=A0A8I0HNM7_9CORY|nr:PorA family porin [Corynebacterium gallinarum]MBD8030099.1 PorA family porin [Corynebacterium gallinarum]